MASEGSKAKDQISHLSLCNLLERLLIEQTSNECVREGEVVLRRSLHLDREHIYG